MFKVRNTGFINLRVKKTTAHYSCCKSDQNLSWPDPSPTKLTLNEISAVGSYKYATTKVQNLSANLFK